MIDYNKRSASQYGVQFGNKFENRIFKRMREDSTNFISQCIWAGYGGADGYSLSRPEDITALRNRVANMYRQTPVWYGLAFRSLEEFAAPPFIYAEQLWNYAINNNSSGPRAVGFNDGRHWTDLDVDVEQGDVIQFFREDTQTYDTSVLIVSDTRQNIVDFMGNIFVAQHSPDFSYRPLINAFRTSCEIETCKLRVLRFVPAFF
ncbi:amidase domain-containing protein [Aminipila sp.]|uniref:amidase domain-containing protein n=1 Tax=Aminipila sp. TaxID=2060095 RepID=UPI00289C2E90|nr:amidase domain-containing protein [Aminipila sp.]